jgi:hypothetical protein
VFTVAVASEGRSAFYEGGRGTFASTWFLAALVISKFVLWMATDTFVFFPVFLGMGVVFGLIFDVARRRRAE